MTFSSLGQGRPHLSSVLLLQLVLVCGIVSLLKPVLKFFLARCPLLHAFLSPFFFLGLIALEDGSRTIRRRTIRCGQLVADNSSQDNSSRTIRRGQFVAKLNINFVEFPASISATFFSSFHFQFSYFFITPASISATFVSSFPLPFQQYFFN